MCKVNQGNTILSKGNDDNANIRQSQIQASKHKNSFRRVVYESYNPHEPMCKMTSKQTQPQMRKDDKYIEMQLIWEDLLHFSNFLTDKVDTKINKKLDP